MKEPTLYSEIEERRDSIQKYADIIRIVKNPSRKTKIMRFANIQYNAFNEALSKLITSGFVDENIMQIGRNERSIYTATKDGEKWARHVDYVYGALQNPRQEEPTII